MVDGRGCGRDVQKLLTNTRVISTWLLSLGLANVHWKLAVVLLSLKLYSGVFALRHWSRILEYPTSIREANNYYQLRVFMEMY